MSVDQSAVSQDKSGLVDDDDKQQVSSAASSSQANRDSHASTTVATTKNANSNSATTRSTKPIKSREHPQPSLQQEGERPLYKRLFNALCCVTEDDDKEGTVLADLGSDRRQYQETTAPSYGQTNNTDNNNNNNSSSNTNGSSTGNGGGKDRILDKPVPPLPANGSRSVGDDDGEQGEEGEDAVVRRAEESVQSPINNGEVIEKTPEVDEEELEPQAKEEWLLESLSKELKGRKCLVLDLDETLVHSSFKFIHQADFIIPVEIENQFHNVYVIKRPGVDEFMKRVGELFEIVVFTASVSKYGDPLLDQLDIHQVIHHRLFRESCYNHQGNYIKNLSQLGRPLNDTIIIDNSPASYIFHPQHAVPVSSWFSDAHDNELLDMLPFLEDLAHESVRDVSMVLDVNIEN